MAPLPRVSVGQYPNDRTGDALRTFAEKFNQAVEILETAINDTSGSLDLAAEVYARTQGDLANADALDTAVSRNERVTARTEGIFRPGIEPRRWRQSSLGVPNSSELYEDADVTTLANEKVLVADGDGAVIAPNEMFKASPGHYYLVEIEAQRTVNPPDADIAGGSVRFGFSFVNDAGANNGAPVVFQYLGVTAEGAALNRRFLIGPQAVPGFTRVEVPEGYNFVPYMQGNGAGQQIVGRLLKVLDVTTAIEEALRAAEGELSGRIVVFAKPWIVPIQFRDFRRAWVNLWGEVIAGVDSTGQFVQVIEPKTPTNVRALDAAWSDFTGRTTISMEVQGYRDITGLGPHGIETAVRHGGAQVMRGADGRPGIVRTAHIKAPAIWAVQDVASNYGTDQTYTTCWSEVHELLHFPAIVQSNGLGAALGDLGTEAFAQTPWNPGGLTGPGALMPKTNGTGMVVAPGTTFDDFEDLYNFQGWTFGGAKLIRATPFPAMARAFHARCQAVFGAEPKTLWSMSGEGGAYLNEVRTGTDRNLNWRDSITQARDIAHAKGWKYVVPWVPVYWSESDWNTLPEENFYRSVRRFIMECSDFIMKTADNETRPIFGFYLNMFGEPDIATPVRLNSANVAITRLDEEFPEQVCAWASDYSFSSAYDGHHDVSGYLDFGDEGGYTCFERLCGNHWSGVKVVNWYFNSDTQVVLEITTPNNVSLTIDTSGTTVGYPSDPNDEAYIGPASAPAIGNRARMCGMEGFDKNGQVGVPLVTIPTSGVVSRAGKRLVFVDLHRAVDRESFVLVGGGRPMTTGSSDNINVGTHLNGARTNIRTTVPRVVIGLGDVPKDRFWWLKSFQIGNRFRR